MVAISWYPVWVCGSSISATWPVRTRHVPKIAHLQLVYINSVRGANRLWGELSVGRDVHGAKRLWGEMSVRRKVQKKERRTGRRRRRGAWRITGRRDGRNRLNTWPVCPAFSWRFVSYFHGLCVYINHERKRTLTYFSNTISNAMKRKVTNIKWSLPPFNGHTK